ncbi:MAG TPA: DUF4149 domain-containing protein [Pseudacidobacterium sp.]|jgi:hypothetical protein|nr:DUF4149 domain-containing protein [Pseudacidobacterium sp.]
MKTALRALILLLIVLWLGGVMFFPIVAATVFTTLADTHTAGTIVGECLRILHYEGLFAGTLIVVLLVAGYRIGAYTRSVVAPVCATLIMLALTAFSQFWIIPRMEGYRLAAGGAIDAVAPDDSNREAFNKLHSVSERVEEGVLVAGIALVILMAREPAIKKT